MLEHAFTLPTFTQLDTDLKKISFSLGHTSTLAADEVPQSISHCVTNIGKAVVPLLGSINWYNLRKAVESREVLYEPLVDTYENKNHQFCHLSVKPEIIWETLGLSSQENSHWCWS